MGKSFHDADATNDLIEGTALDDSLMGTDGRDQMYGYAGDDTLEGGDGNDALYGDDGMDFLYGGSGNDTVRGGEGEDSVDGDAGIDSLYGGRNSDFLSDNGLDALYDGGGGNDFLVFRDQGSSGFTVDLSLTSAQFVRADATQGVVIRSIENVIGSEFADVFTGNDKINYFDAGDGNDTLNGGGGNDLLFGSFGDDTLYGGAGNDYLSGGDIDKDMLSGGDGKDTFDIERPLGKDVDTVLDFDGAEDIITLGNGEFSGYGFNLLGEGQLDAELFVANASGKAQDADDYLVYNTTNGKLWYDTDGSGAGKAQLIAVIGVSSHPALTAADFEVLLS